HRVVRAADAAAVLADGARLDAAHTAQQIAGQIEVGAEVEVDARLAAAAAGARGARDDAVDHARAGPGDVRVRHRQRRTEEAAGLPGVLGVVDARRGAVPVAAALRGARGRE